MEFKKLELTPQGSWFTRKIWTPHGKKTILYIVLGATISLLFHAITRDGELSEITTNEILNSAGIGALFGLFITNSPCARGKC